MSRLLLALAALTLAAPAAAQTPAAPLSTELAAPGPLGPLAGTLLDPGGSAPLVLILAGSGPTDRNGDNRYGITGGPYRQLAEALAKRGIATLRVDKRGQFGSKGAVADGNAVTIADYAADTRHWIDTARQRTGRHCIWLAGHSEGGLVALLAAQQPQGVCGVILLSAAGRPLADIMREQFRANPANGPILDAALRMIDTLAAGKHVDMTTMPAPLPALFPDRKQDFLIDQFRYDPPKLAATLKLPLLVTQGDHDIQVGLGDARALAAAKPGATHVLRIAPGDTPAASVSTYADPSLPVVPALIEAISAFVTAAR